MASEKTAPAVSWPERFRPGFVDNYVSNEVVVRGLTTADVWPYVADVAHWTSYYDNCSDITPPPSGTALANVGEKFRFGTFGLAPLAVVVAESVAPVTGGTAGRLAWQAKDNEDAPTFEAYHAWIFEDVPYPGTDETVLRVLTQETQLGKLAAELATTKPNTVLLGHQNWLDSLIKYAKEKKAAGKA